MFFRVTRAACDGVAQCCRDRFRDSFPVLSVRKGFVASLAPFGKMLNRILTRSFNHGGRWVGSRGRVRDQEEVKLHSLGERIRACPEFAMIPFHPLAGRIVGDKQFFFDGSFTTFPWATEEMHRHVEFTRGASEPQEILPFLEIMQVLPEDAVSLELGAGWGFYSIILGRRLPRAKMILVEAHPHLLEIARKNMRANGLSDRCIVIHGAASDRDGDTVSFSDDGYGSAISNDGPFRVPTVSVDAIMKRLGIPKVHILHMDVQGAEHRVLRGLKEALTRGAIDYLFVGTHSQALHLLCQQLLNALGYRTLLSLDMNESASGDGILVCARGDLDPRCRLRDDRATALRINQ